MSAIVTKILSKKEILGADKIELISVLGWNVVVGKSENFQVDNLVVYFGISSILKDDAPYRPNGLASGKPIKTIKIRGVVSQGYVTNLSILDNIENKEWKEGDDVTTLLGVTRHYEPEEIDIHVGEHKFPEHLVKRTEQARIQNHPWMINSMLNKPIRVSIKYDGTSATYIHGGLIYSRNQQASDVGTVYFNIARENNIFAKIPEHLAIQGEICGPKIQKNKLGLPKNTFFVFDIFNTQTQQYLTYLEMQTVCKNMGLNMIQHIGWFATGAEYLTDVEKLLEIAGATKYPNNTLAEGIVISEDGGDRERLSFKVISNEFLIKYKL